MSDGPIQFDRTTPHTPNKLMLGSDGERLRTEMLRTVFGNLPTAREDTPPPLAQQAAILRSGTPHPAIAGLSVSVDAVALQANYDLATEDGAIFADTKNERLYQIEEPLGALSLDVAELVDRSIGVYAGQSFNEDVPSEESRDVYLTHEPPRAIILTGSSTAPSGFRLYGGRFARLKGDPAGDAEPWESHPDSTEDVPLFAMTELAGMGDANYATGAVVLAVQRSFTKGGGRDAGKAWLIVGGGGGASLPELEYQHMVYQAVTDNSIGGDFVRVHAPGV